MSEPTGRVMVPCDWGPDYPMCDLDTPEKQARCSEYRVTPAGWCAWGRCDTDRCGWRDERRVDHG